MVLQNQDRKLRNATLKVRGEISVHELGRFGSFHDNRPDNIPSGG